MVAEVCWGGRIRGPWRLAHLCACNLVTCYMMLCLSISLSLSLSLTLSLPLSPSLSLYIWHVNINMHYYTYMHVVRWGGRRGGQGRTGTHYMHTSYACMYIAYSDGGSEGRDAPERERRQTATEPAPAGGVSVAVLAQEHQMWQEARDSLVVSAQGPHAPG